MGLSFFSVSLYLSFIYISLSISSACSFVSQAGPTVFLLREMSLFEFIVRHYIHPHNQHSSHNFNTNFKFSWSFSWQCRLSFIWLPISWRMVCPERKRRSRKISNVLCARHRMRPGNQDGFGHLPTTHGWTSDAFSCTNC